MADTGERIATLENEVKGHGLRLDGIESDMKEHGQRLTRVEVRLTLMVIAAAAIGGVLGSGLGDIVKAILGR